jgi:hypothetical protein
MYKLLLIIIGVVLASSYLYYSTQESINTIKLNNVETKTSFDKEDSYETYYIKSIHENHSFKEWIKIDKDYLNNIANKKVDVSKIESEINLISKELDNIKNNYYIETNSNAKLYPPNISGTIHALYNGIDNRMMLIKNVKDFKYEDKVFKDGYYNKLSTINKNVELEEIPDKRLNLIFETVLDSLNSNIIPKDLLNGIEIFLAPYYLDSQGWTVGSPAYTTSNQVIIMGEPFIVADGRDLPNNEYKYIINTILFHEVGHIFQKEMILSEVGENVNSDEVKDSNINNDYKKVYPDLKFDSSYKNSILESFSDNFGYYMSSKVLNVAYDELSKPTKLYLKLKNPRGYDDARFSEFLEKYIGAYNVSKIDIPNLVASSEGIDNLSIYISGYNNKIALTSNKLDIKFDEKDSGNFNNGMCAFITKKSNSKKDYVVALQFKDMTSLKSSEDKMNFRFFKDGEYDIAFYLIDEKGKCDYKNPIGRLEVSVSDVNSGFALIDYFAY